MAGVTISVSNTAPKQIKKAAKKETRRQARVEKRQEKVEIIKELVAKKVAKHQEKLEKKNAKRIARGKEAKADKSWIAALLICWFVGVLGIHRFYLGYTWQGVVQLLTLGGLGIWTLIDFIRIIVRDLLPADGNYTD